MRQTLMLDAEDLITLFDATECNEGRAARGLCIASGRCARRVGMKTA
jgi:hypothetical protein